MATTTTRFPLAGTVQRAVWDAMHAVWCGPGCNVGPGCTAWHPDRREQQAAIDAVHTFDAQVAADRKAKGGPTTAMLALRRLLEAMPGNDDKHEFEAALAHAQQVAWP